MCAVRVRRPRHRQQRSLSTAVCLARRQWSQEPILLVVVAGEALIMDIIDRCQSRYGDSNGEEGFNGLHKTRS